jgi:hypothetical protein
MKVYQNLVFRGTRPALEQFVSEIEHLLDNGWTRDYAREGEVRTPALGRMYCFACTALGSRPASELFLVNSDGDLHVSNVLSDSALTYDQYNAIVQEFHRFAVPAAESAGVSVDLGEPDFRIENCLDPRTAKLLRSFSALANRSILHPLDRERWNQFVTAAHREGTRLSASMLRRWLIEEEKWPEDVASSLAVEYEHARELLGVYESQLS